MWGTFLNDKYGKFFLKVIYCKLINNRKKNYWSKHLVDFFFNDKYGKLFLRKLIIS